ncbi:MAG TPA: UvrD-helicase domain-containing protein [Solirubrobacteraceae bacterium]|nr:UvrD-helicase domain-containing protein [Solirubrobacteraceae bacterium]
MLDELDTPRPPGQLAPDDEDRVERLLDGLNEPQREAVTHGEGPLLILAGAGSGKTRVLTHRIAFLIYTGQARAEEILAITFTNKAAQEMRDRVQRLTQDPGPGARRGTRGMWLMTFHAACARILRAEAPRLGYTRQFTIYDQADTRRLVRRCADELGIDPKRFTPAAIHSQISAAKNRLLAAEQLRRKTGSPFEELVADVYELYERELLRMNAMDFDDLLFCTINVFELYDEVRTRYATAFRHVLVDEYQDTNHAQYRLLQLLVGGGRERAEDDRRPAESAGRERGDDAEGSAESAGAGEPIRAAANGRPPGRSGGAQARLVGHRNLAVVGDDSQSIYSFRCADIRNILDFQDDFPDARVIKLEQNYRSTQRILSAANAVIANNRGGIAKRLWSDLGEGSQVHVRELDDEHAEARFLVAEIERLVDEGGSRAEIAVLYRTNAMSRVIEDALVRREIAYQVIGGTKFYERAEIKDAVAYLSWLANPFDVVSFTRVANSPRRGLGQTSLARIFSHADSIGVSVREAMAAPEQIPGLSTKALRALARFATTMAELDEMLERAVPVADLLEAVLARTGYLDALEAEALGGAAKAIEAQGRIENLDQLVEVAREFDAAAGGEEASLDVFLQQLALVADADSRREDDGLVTLMTLHNAKGLEYPVVFIAGCEDGVFPHSRALQDGSLEEERRLFYVGVTRAKRELYLTYARRRTVFGSPTYGLRSRFIDEIPAELTDCEEELILSRSIALDGIDGGTGAGRGSVAGMSGGGGRNGRARAGAWGSSGDAPAGSTPAFRMGEDVVHAAFGEGVVTGLEPGGVIVVRFAGDGSERKLMAEYAPVSRR